MQDYAAFSTSSQNKATVFVSKGVRTGRDDMLWRHLAFFFFTKGNGFSLIACATFLIDTRSESFLPHLIIPASIPVT
jgi:hypothetical protein